MNEDLPKRVEFDKELEKLKTIYRQNGVLDRSRPENTAEHSWHIAVMAIIHLEDLSVPPDSIDLLKVIKMLLIHDIVEIKAGDTFLYDKEGKENIQLKEERAALITFGLLPEKQKDELMALWKEFEERKSPEARYAAALDGLQPLLNHLITARVNENSHKITVSAIIEKKKFIEDISPRLWAVAMSCIKKSVDQGLYINDIKK